MRTAASPHRTDSPRRPYAIEHIDANGARISLRIISADQPGTALWYAAQDHFRVLIVSAQDVADHVGAGGTVEVAFPTPDPDPEPETKEGIE